MRGGSQVATAKHYWHRSKPSKYDEDYDAYEEVISSLLFVKYKGEDVSLLSYLASRRPWRR